MAQGTNGAECLRWKLKDGRHAACKRGWNNLRGEHGKMSVDFPNDPALCQRFLSAEAQFVPTLEVNVHRLFGRSELFPTPLAPSSATSILSKRKEPVPRYWLATSGRNKIERLLVWFSTIAIALVASALIFAGLLLCIELVRDRQSKEPAHKECAQVMENCKEMGLRSNRHRFSGNMARD